MDIMNSVHLGALDLNLLVVLRELLATGSVSETARRIARTQSAVSHALGRLRRMFDDPLFVRVGLRMTPTARAQELAARLRDALGRMEEVIALRGAFDPTRLRRGFRIGMADYHELVLLPRLLRRVARAAPAVELSCLDVGDAVEERTRSGDLDVSIAPAARRLPGLAWEPLFEDRFATVLRRGHPLARGKLTLARFRAAEHLVVAPRGRPGSLVDDRLAALGTSRRVVARVTHFLTAAVVAARTDLVLTLPARVAAELRPFGLVVRPPPVALAPIVLGLLFSEAYAADPAHRWLREQVAAAAAP
jgi:DNA-binding transcriptional LysR family regulator